jgi:hypothetical protein
MNIRNIIKNLLHENLKKDKIVEDLFSSDSKLTHVKQVSNGELGVSEDWKSIVWGDNYEVSVSDYKKIMKNFNEYKELPWEKEAYNNMWDETLRDELYASSYWNDLKGKDETLDFIIDNM